MLKKLLIGCAILIGVLAAFLFRPETSSTRSPQPRGETVISVTVAPAKLDTVHDRIMDLTDYARHYLVDRFSTLDGVARVQIGGGLEYSMRIWVDSNQLAARNLT
jgi:multidrug efflux pump subunit AcrB